MLRDPKDAVIVAAASAYGATFLVSGDKDILTLPPIPGLLVGTTRQALEWLAGGGQK